MHEPIPRYVNTESHHKDRRTTDKPRSTLPCNERDGGECKQKISDCKIMKSGHKIQTEQFTQDKEPRGIHNRKVCVWRKFKHGVEPRNYLERIVKDIWNKLKLICDKPLVDKYEGDKTEEEKLNKSK